MLDINYIRSQKERVIEGMKQKGESDVSVVDQVLEVDTRWRQMVTRLDRLRSESNQKAKQIGKLMGEGRQEEAREIIEETSSAKQSIKKQKRSSQESAVKGEICCSGYPMCHTRRCLSARRKMTMWFMTPMASQKPMSGRSRTGSWLRRIAGSILRGG